MYVLFTMRIAILSLLLISAPAAALNEGLQCVPYARALTGVEIRGDAHTWWKQAEGRYQRGSRPKVGAILSFRPFGSMRLGHVAAVRKIVDARTIMISHANWSTIGGIRGHIENDVKVVDASADNDWSEVRVWYSPNNALGTTEWPVNGFIYPQEIRGKNDAQQAVIALLGGRNPTAAKSLSIANNSVRPNPKINTQPKSALRLSGNLMKEIEVAAAQERQAGRKR